MTIHLVVGLGNPGRRFEGTRHNIGFMVVEQLARRLNAPSWRSEHRALTTRVAVGNGTLLLAKPQTFMNNSGQAVRALAHWYNFAPDTLLVVSDDLDLPFGRMRLRPGGSPGGHNGLRSIIAELGTQDFARLRMGIGRPSSGDPLAWVLTAFSPQEQRDLEYICSIGVDAVLRAAGDGVLAAMNAYNGRADVRDPLPVPSAPNEFRASTDRAEGVRADG